MIQVFTAPLTVYCVSFDSDHEHYDVFVAARSWQLAHECASLALALKLPAEQREKVASWLYDVRPMPMEIEAAAYYGFPEKAGAK